MDERIQKYEEKMKKTLASLESELVTIRAGRANPHILDKLAVDYYGAPTPLQQVANITVPEARMIQIQPWESSLIKGIEKAILTSDLGLNPSNDGKVIRLVFPELTEERRTAGIKGKSWVNSSVKQIFGAVRNLWILLNNDFKVILVDFCRSGTGNLVIKINGCGRPHTADNAKFKRFGKLFPALGAKIVGVDSDNINQTETGSI